MGRYQDGVLGTEALEISVEELIPGTHIFGG